MADVQPQLQSQANLPARPSRLSRIAADNYALLLAVGVAVLMGSLIVLLVLYLTQYGLGAKLGPSPLAAVAQVMRICP